MDDFIKVYKKDPQIRVKINAMLGRYNRLPYNCQSKIGYDTLIQNAILEEFINIRGSSLTDMDIELKMKINRLERLEGRKK